LKLLGHLYGYLSKSDAPVAGSLVSPSTKETGSDQLAYTESTLPIDPQDSLPGIPPKTRSVAFLLSRYPAISHTFFLKEILGLRKRGMDIRVASINPPDRPRQDLPAVEGAEAAATFYIKAGGKLGLLARVLSIALSHPGVAWRGLKSALKFGNWDLKGRAYSFFYMAEALLVGDWMRRHGLSHLHVHFGGAVATVGMVTSQAWQIPWSVTLHGPDEFFDQDAFYLRQKIESAAFIICISDFCRSQVLRVAPSVVDSRLEVVRLGVDCETLQPDEIRQPLACSELTASVSPASAPTSPFHIVCTGRMVAAKGHRILLEALSALIASDVSLTCTLIGDGPERPVLEEQARRQGISGNVHFLGALAHGPTLERVATADVFVLASFAEGLPVALMEAMALGIPCISTTIAAIPELIHDRQNGLLVPPANVEALREALARLAAEPELRHQLGIEARATAESEYNLAHNLDRLAAMWNRRLANPGSRPN